MYSEMMPFKLKIGLQSKGLVWSLRKPQGFAPSLWTPVEVKDGFKTPS